MLFYHRYATSSGAEIAHDISELSLSVAPIANGDGTITVSCKFINGTIPGPSRVTESGPVTMVDGGTSTQQVGRVRFIITATTDSQYFASSDARREPATFVEGTYVLPPYHLAGATYHFENGGVTVSGFTDVGPQPAPMKGLYREDRGRIVLSLDGDAAANSIFHYRIIDGVHLLIDEKLVSASASRQQLSLSGDALYSCLILIPPHTVDFMEWWSSLPKKHPGFAKLMLEKFP